MNNHGDPWKHYTSTHAGTVFIGMDMKKYTWGLPVLLPTQGKAEQLLIEWWGSFKVGTTPGWYQGACAVGTWKVSKEWWWWWQPPHQHPQPPLQAFACRVEMGSTDDNGTGRKTRTTGNGQNNGDKGTVLKMKMCGMGTGQQAQWDIRQDETNREGIKGPQWCTQNNTQQGWHHTTTPTLLSVVGGGGGQFVFLWS